MSHLTEQELEDMEALFVQTTASRPSDGQTLNPQGLSPSTSYFSGSVLLLKHHRRCMLSFIATLHGGGAKWRSGVKS